MATQTRTATTTSGANLVSKTLKLLGESKCYGGVIHRYQHPSVKCNCDMKFHMFFPPTQEEKVPILWILSGLTDDDTSLVSTMGAQRVAAEKGICLIFPDTSPRDVKIANLSDDQTKLLEQRLVGPGAGYYLNATTDNCKKHYNMFDYVTDELPKLIAANFPSLDFKNQSIMGHSMGGHGALVAFFTKDTHIKYVSVSAFAPMCSPSAKSFNHGAYTLYMGDNLQEWEKYDAFVLMANFDGDGTTRVLIDQGTSDQIKHETMKLDALEKALNEKKNIKLQVNYRDGYDHGNYFVSTFIESHMTFHARALADGQSGGKYNAVASKNKLRNVISAISAIRKAEMKIRWIFKDDNSIKSNFKSEYELGQQLGQPGQYGVAHECTKISDGKQYAVKIIDKARFVDSCRKEDRKSYYQQFKDEIDIMKKIQHKNLIKLYEVFEDIMKLYLVMEKCTGGELFDRIREKGKYSEKDAANVLRDLAEGIQAMHIKKIAHCDLKPDNCLFVDGRDDSPLKIIDFGMSKHSPNSNITGFRGTPYYVAPEIISQPNYTYHCDMWSFGVITFVMLFGFPPFFSRDNDDNEIFKKIQNGFNPVTKKGYGPWFPKNRSVTPAAKNFIANCLQTDITKRFTALEALEDAWLTGKAASAEPLLDNVLSSLTQFNANCKFKSAILATMSDVLTENEVATLKKTFQSIDTNGDMTISAQELQEAIENSWSNDSLSEDQQHELESLQVLIKCADVDGDGKLSYEELLATTIYRKMQMKEERIHKAFLKFDLNKDGKISEDELKQVLKLSGNRPDKETQAVVDIFKSVDTNNDGFVDYQEFLVMWQQQEKERMTGVIDSTPAV